MHAAMRALVAVGVIGCSKPTITGQVVDVGGDPVAGATVTNTTGALCIAESGNDGRFELSCGGDDGLVLAVVLEGWFSQEVKAMGAFDEELGEIRLVKKAPAHGLWRWSERDWRPFDKPARARRDVARNGQARTHYLVRKGYEANEVASGTMILLDDSAEEWRMWRLDGDKIHAETAPEPSRWETAYGESPKMQYEKIEGGRDLITVSLDPGEYFIADWTHGQFNLNKKDKLYKGRWVVAR